MKVELKTFPPYQVLETSAVRPAGIVIRLGSGADPGPVVSIEWDMTPEEAAALAADLCRAVETAQTLPVREMWRKDGAR